MLKVVLEKNCPVFFQRFIFIWSDLVCSALVVFVGLARVGLDFFSFTHLFPNPFRWLFVSSLA